MFSPPLSSLLRLLIRELQIWGCGRPQVQDFTESFSHIIVEKYSTWKALLKNFSLVVIFMLNITPSKVSMHLRQQVATTCHGNTSQQQIASCVLDNFCENLCLWNRVLSVQQVAQIQYHLIFYDWLQQQNSVPETKIFTKI